MEELAITLAVLLVAVALIFFLYRRFRQAVADVPRVCQVAAAIALTFGILNLITGVGHSVAVVSLALSDSEYGPLQILRFTTGAMLIYSGTIAAALYRSISVGRRSAIAAALASGVLFEVYLLFLLPLPGTGGTVPPMLALWSLYLVWLGAAAVASMPEAARAHTAGLGG